LMSLFPTNLWVVLAVCCVSASAFTDHSNIAPLAQHSLAAPLTEHTGFKLTGSATSTEDYIRLTPATASNDGAVWNTEPLSYGHWEAAIDFRVTGERFLGGDGFAFWYTKGKETRGGTFGNNDAFVGLGIFFDTYDNDGKRDNPSISAYVSDGSMRYDHATDGEQTRLDGGFCRVSYRNTRKPAKIRITYNADDSTLSLYYDVKGTNHYQQCFSLQNIHLPPGYFFGLTAHTGDVADNHDIYGFQTRSLKQQPAEGVTLQASEEMPEGPEEKVEPVPPAQPVKTDADHITPLVSMVKRWLKMDKAARDTIRAKRVEQHQSRTAADDDHAHEHDDEDHERSGPFEAKVLSFLEGIQGAVNDLFGEVEEVGKAVAEVNFDVNTNVMPQLASLASKKEAGAGEAAPAPASASAPPADSAGGEKVDHGRLEAAIKHSSDATIKSVSSLFDDQVAKIKTLGVDVAEIKGIVKNRLGDKRHDDEVFAKLSLLSNEMVKLKAMVQDIHSARTGSNDELKSHIENLSTSMSNPGSTSWTTLTLFGILQLVILAAFMLWKKYQDEKKMHLL